MPCIAPIPAWRDHQGVVSLKEPDRSVALRNLEGRGIHDRREYVGVENLHLPCGRCVGCRVSKAREWAIRCTFEAAQHDHSSFVTLTYDDEHCPPQLRKADLSGWVKRVRARVDTRFKFFACGEYGERTARPHYHALVFGLREAALFQDCWKFGFTRTDEVTPASIAYVAGYVSKKYGSVPQPREWVNTETGEVIEAQPEFRLMSRRPGIAAPSREHWRSFRKEVIWQGQKVPVPRYLHEAWRQQATEEMLEQLREEKRATARVVTSAGLEAAQRRTEVRLEQKASTRRNF